MTKEIQAINEVWRKESDKVSNAVSESVFAKIENRFKASREEKLTLKTLMLGGTCHLTIVLE